MISLFQHSIWDARAFRASVGFFDHWQRPPWDTWVACVGTPHHAVIIAWIPQPWIEAAQKGIDACPVKNVRWLSDDFSDFADQLRSKQLL